jgi:hypothetical protein
LTDNGNEGCDPVGAESLGAVGALVLFAFLSAECRQTAPRETPSVWAMRLSEYLPEFNISKPAIPGERQNIDFP